MNLIDEIVEKYKTAGIRGVLDGAILRIYLICRNYWNNYWDSYFSHKRFNGKDLDVVQGKIQKAIKKRSDLYLLDENDARAVADNWNGVISKPQDLHFIEDAIPVVLSAGEKLASVMAVALQSLLNNTNSERKYHFIILNEDFSDKTKDLLMHQVSGFPHCVIDFVNVAHVFHEIPIAPLPNKSYSIYVWLPLLIPYWFDKYEKVIFFDSDILVKADIAELYDINISDFSFAAAVDQYIKWLLKQKDYTFFLRSSPSFMLANNWVDYLNTGVMVFDTQKFKMRFPQEDFFRLAIYYSNRYAFCFPELDFLWILLKDDYYVLPQEWNYYPFLSGESGSPPPFKQKIAHFAGRKPWELDALSDTDPDVLEWRKLDTIQFFLKNQEKVHEVASWLFDEESKNIYLTSIKHRQTNKPSDLPEYDSGGYFRHSFFTYGNNEVLIDCGAYTGDTIQEFLSMNIPYEKIVAFEPGPENFANLVNFAKDKGSKIMPINAGIYDKDCELYFLGWNTSETPKGVTGEVCIKVRSIDGLHLEEKITLIKMDIEGAEMKALIGAKETILRDKPKLAISLYHSNEDLIDIAKYIHELVPEYKLYVRRNEIQPFSHVVLFATV